MCDMHDKLFEDAREGEAAGGGAAAPGGEGRGGARGAARRVQRQRDFKRIKANLAKDVIEFTSNSLYIHFILT